MSFKVIKSGTDTNRKSYTNTLAFDWSRGCPSMTWVERDVVPIESSMSCYYSITHRFRDTSCFNAENHIFAYPTCIWPWICRSKCRWNVETKFGARKLEPWAAIRRRNVDRRSNHAGAVNEYDR